MKVKETSESSIVDLQLKRKILIPSEVVVYPDCPFSCELVIENEDIVSEFDSTTGDLVVFNGDPTLGG